MHHPDVLRAQVLQDVGERLNPSLVEYAKNLMLDASWIADRSEQIKDCADAEFGANRSPLFHSRMVHRRPHEANAGLFDGAGNHVGSDVDFDTECGKHVRSACQRGH